MDWQPIDTCPFYRFVLLWCPENGVWADTWWVGQRIGGCSRSYGQDLGFKIATPYGNGGRQVWCPIEPDGKWPTHWAELPARPNPSTT